MKRLGSVLGLSVALCFSVSVRADWSDDFESYAPGDICDQGGGWEAWTPGTDVCGEVSTEFASSGENSLKIIGATGPGGDDTVQLFNEEGGQWMFRTMTYIPGDATGQASIILLNTFPTVGNQSWSAVVALNADTGDIVRWTNVIIGSVIKDRWVEFRYEIDIDADTYDIFYDDVMLDSGLSWRDAILPGGNPTIQALDLYGDEPGGQGTTGTFFDDIELIAGGGADTCQYTVKKNSKGKKGCDSCPNKNDTYATEDECEGVKDCKKKIKLKKSACPDGGPGFCKKIIGKRDSCGS